jgi:hypothetical protein
VNVVCPGYIEGSPMFEAAIANVSRRRANREDGARDSREAVATAAFVTLQEWPKCGALCSDEAAGTTGQAIVVDGGERGIMIRTRSTSAGRSTGRVATITLNRPERKNPLTFESYAELIETFRALVDETDIRAVV